MMHQSLSPAELVTRYQSGIWRYLRFLGAMESQADDLTQETFLAVLRQPEPFEQRSNGETSQYLRTVARNQFLMMLRKQRRAPDLVALDEADAVWEKLAEPSGGDDYLEALQDCLSQVTDRGRLAIQYRYREGHSREEIGEMLGMTADGVKTLLRRTREALRSCVETKVLAK